MHVLDKLKPPSSLVELTIRCYGGQSFPSNWFKDPAPVFNLVVLKLENCKKCKYLPSLERLSSLKDLTIEGMASLKRIDFQMPLKSLEVLRFENLQEWEHWDTWRGNEDVEILAQLRELCIKECPKLTGEFPDHLPSLERFVIRDSSKLVVSVSCLPEECKVDIDSLNKGVVCNDGSINFERLDSRWLQNIPEVESKLKEASQRVECLTIDGSNEITDSWKCYPDIEGYLTVGGMYGLTFIEQFLPNLRVLEFEKCHSLISLPGELKQKNLEILTITRCDSLRSIDCSMLPSSLKILRITSCEKLEFLKDLSTSLLEELRISFCNSLRCTSPRDQCLYLPKALTLLSIHQCRELKSINGTCTSPRDQCLYLPKTLTFLSIEQCRELKSITGSFEKSMCLRYISLVDCENLESIPVGLQNLSRVDSLRIEGCPKLLVREGVPTSLIDLHFVGGLQFDKPMIEWELHNLTTLGIKECPRIKSIPNLTSLTSLTRFIIWECPMLESIHNLTSLTSLTKLTILECPMLQLIPNLTSLTSLTEFTIRECPVLKSIHNLTSLTSLTEFTIDECPRIESIPNLTTSLTTLTIQRCPMLESIPVLGSLEHLRIMNCPKLKSLQSLPSSLLSLFVEDCPLLTKQWNKGKKRYCSKIAHIPAVHIDHKFIFNSKEEE